MEWKLTKQQLGRHCGIVATSVKEVDKQNFWGSVGGTSYLYPNLYLNSNAMIQSHRQISLFFTTIQHTLSPMSECLVIGVQTLTLTELSVTDIGWGRNKIAYPRINKPMYMTRMCIYKIQIQIQLYLSRAKWFALGIGNDFLAVTMGQTSAKATIVGSTNIKCSLWVKGAFSGSSLTHLTHAGLWREFPSSAL